MSVYKFEDLKSVKLTPHLSSGTSPIIQGKYVYYCLNQKEAGTGSELHYHPNELLIFALKGKINAVVGKERKIVYPGTFILIPPNVRHSMKATEDEPCAYLYIKDCTWTVVGVSADEELPDKPMSVEEANQKFEKGEIQDRKNKGANSTTESDNKSIIIEGVPNCYYKILDNIEQPYSVGNNITSIQGERMDFKFYELNKNYDEEQLKSDHEYFFYILDGTFKFKINNKEFNVDKGSIVKIQKDENYKFSNLSQRSRIVAINSNKFLESKIS